MTTCSSVSIPAFEQVNTCWVLRASFIDKTKAFFSFIKVKCKFWNHHTSKMGDCSLNPLKFFTENCKIYRNLAKPVTPVRFYFSVKFINNTFDKLNNIYYCFLLSRTAIESHPGKQLFCYKSTSLRFKGFSWVLHLLYYIQKGTISLERSFGVHQLFIETF